MYAELYFDDKYAKWAIGQRTKFIQLFFTFFIFLLLFFFLVFFKLLFYRSEYRDDGDTRRAKRRALVSHENADFLFLVRERDEHSLRTLESSCAVSSSIRCGDDLKELLVEYEEFLRLHDWTISLLAPSALRPVTLQWKRIM